MNKKEIERQKVILDTAHKDFEKGLHKYSFYKTQNQSRSQDLVQDTFLKTWKYILGGGNIILMKAFLYRILNNLIIDEYRKHKTTSLDTLIENGFDISTDETSRLFNFIDGKSATKLISKLPKKYREILSMRFAKDLSFKEMAKITGQSKNSMAVQAHRGMQKLKTLHRPTNKKPR
jgi:RNA polymerase sigma-70 factor (ECF subfamily)